MTLLDWWVLARRSYLASAFLVILLSIDIRGSDVLKIVYPAQSFHLQQGDPLILNCTVRHQQEQSQRVKVHWCKLVEKSPDCVNIEKDTEKVQLSELPDSEGYRSLSLLLQIPQVEQSDRGNYQCRASISNPNQSAVGHYVTVNVSGPWTSVNTSSIFNTTQRSKEDFQRNKALKRDFQLVKKSCILIVILVLIAI